MSAGHTEQLKAWALDRAIETLKHTPGNCNSTSVMAVAEEYVAWVSVSDDPAAPIEGDVLPETQVQ